MAVINNSGGLMWNKQGNKQGNKTDDKKIIVPPSSTGGASGRPSEEAKAPNNGGSSAVKPPSGSAGTGSGYSEEARPKKEITIPPPPVPTAPKAPGMDDLGNVDYSKKWDSALSGGADYDTLRGIYNGRNDKIKGDSAYGEFAGDAKSQEMKSVLDKMEAERKNAEREAYLREMYEAQQKAALDALRAAYDKNVAGLDRAQAGIAPQYQSARNEAAGQAELQKKNFAEYAAANGLNSGAGGQAQLAFGNALQNNLSGIAQKEASTMADLELQRSQMETDFNSAIAQAEAQGNYELAQQLYQEKVRQDEAMRQQMQFQAQQDLQKEQLAWNKEQADIANSQWDKSFGADSAQNDKTWAFKMAQEMAQYGNFDGYKALGYSDTEIQSMKDYWSWMQQAAAKKTGGGSGGGTGTGKLTAAQAFSAFNDGFDTPEIRAAIEPVYGRLWEEATPGGSGGGYVAAKSTLGSLIYNYGRKGENNQVIAQKSMEYVNQQVAAKKISAQEADELMAYAATLMKG